MIWRGWFPIKTIRFNDLRSKLLEASLAGHPSFRGLLRPTEITRRPRKITFGRESIFDYFWRLGYICPLRTRQGGLCGTKSKDRRWISVSAAWVEGLDTKLHRRTRVSGTHSMDPHVQTFEQDDDLASSERRDQFKVRSSL